MLRIDIEEQTVADFERLRRRRTAREEAQHRVRAVAVIVDQLLESVAQCSHPGIAALRYPRSPRPSMQHWSRASRRKRRAGRVTGGYTATRPIRMHKG